MLANIFLHHVLDEWFEQEVQPRMKGRCFLIRFADDFVIGCELEADARRIMAVLPKRFARFGLTIHPTKTALIAFRKPADPPRDRPRERHIRLSRIDPLLDEITPGILGDQTQDSQEAAPPHQEVAVAVVSQRIVTRRCNTSTSMLCQKLRGHFQYYGIRGNFRLLEEVRRYAEKAWRYWLSRRSSKSAIGWEKFQKLLETYVLPTPKIVHTI